MKFRHTQDTPGQGYQYGDSNLQQNYFAPVTQNLFSGGFERLRDVCFDPWVLERDLDLPRFTGREWLIGRIDEFLRSRRRGYVIILAEAGVGKSCLAAHLVGSRPWLYHFTRLTGGRSPEAARKSLAAQLISRWDLEEWAPNGVLPSSADRPDWFDRLLNAAAKQRDEREPNEQIVLVVDGLDEFEEGATGSAGLRLGLPISLPDGVFVIATSRFGIERVLHAVRNPAEWHQIEVEGTDNLEDMQQFIHRITDPEKGDRHLNQALQNCGADRARFRDTLADRCAGVWIYMRYVLDEIRDGARDPRRVEKLPCDLAGYYAEQVARWRGDPDNLAQQDRWEQVYLPLLGTLAVTLEPLTIEELDSFARASARESTRIFVEETARAFLNRHDHQQPVRFGIRHQSLRDLLTGIVPDNRPDLHALATTFADQANLSHERIARTLMPLGGPGERIWRSSSAYARQHLPTHAAACGLLDGLLSDPGFLVAARPEGILTNRGNLRSVEARRAAAALRLSMDGWASCGEAERLKRLAVNAARMRAFPLIDACSKLTGVTWPIRWAAMSGQIHQIILGHPRSVEAVAIGQAADRDVIVSGSADRTICVWDAATGDRICGPLLGHHGAVKAVAIGKAAGHDVIVSGSEDGTLRIWDAVTGDQVSDPLIDHAAAVNTVAIGQAAGRDVIVSGSNDETVQVWDAVTGDPIGGPFTGDSGVVYAVAIGKAAGRDVIVSGSQDGTLRVWDAATGSLLGDPLSGHNDWVNAVAIGNTPDGDVIVSGSEDGTIWAWDAETHEPIGNPLTYHGEAVAAIAIGQAAGTDVIISCSSHGTFRVWDACTGDPISGPPVDHAGVVTAVAIGHSAGGDVIVSGAVDGTVMVWDAAVLDPLTGHDGPVTAVAIGQVAGRDIIVSGCLGEKEDDEYSRPKNTNHPSRTKNVLRIWNAATGDPIGEPLMVQEQGVGAIAIGQVNGRDIIVSGSLENEQDIPVEDHDYRNRTKHMLRIWDAATGDPAGELPTDHLGGICTIALGQVAGRDVIVSGGILDRTVLVWDAVTRKRIGEPLTGRSGAVALGQVAGRDVIVSGDSWDGTVLVWDAVTRERIGEPLTGHSGAVNTVALGQVAGRDVIVSGDENGRVLIWDTVTRKRIGEPLTGHSGAVNTVALGQVAGRDVIVSGSADHSLFLREHYAG